MNKIKRVLFIDSGTSSGQGGWQISRGVFEGLRACGVEAELFPLSARLDRIRSLHARSLDGSDGGSSDLTLMEWACGTLAERALLFEPDLVIAMKGTRVSESALAALRAAGIPLAAWTMDDPYEIDRYLLWAPNYDMVFTTEPRCLAVYEAAGVPFAEYMPHAHDTGLHKPDAGYALSNNYFSDICFIGSAYPERVRLMRETAAFLAAHKTVLIGNWGAYRHELPGVRVLDGFVPEKEAVKFYSGAKIVLNMHRLADENFSGLPFSGKIGADGVNSRTFEIAGTGAFQLADSGRRYLEKLFKPGIEIETFSGAEEMQSKISRYLYDEGARTAIATAGRKRALAEHTYKIRAGQLLDTADVFLRSGAGARAGSAK